jgi:hypothetical protein
MGVGPVEIEGCLILTHPRPLCPKIELQSSLRPWTWHKPEVITPELPKSSAS